MAVAAIAPSRSERAEYARDARLARALALIIDTVAFILLSLLVNSVYGVSHVTGGSPYPSAAGVAMISTSTDVGWGGLTLLAIAYFAVPEALFGATPGKFLAGLRVVRADGRPLDLRSVLVRNVLRPIDSMPLLYLIGGVSVLLTADSQRLGDRAAGTTVVYRHRALGPGATLGSTPSARRTLVAMLVAALLLSMAFDYFGRPPLVIQGMYNTQSLLMRQVTSYSLGRPQWGFGEVTYPITVTTSPDTPVNGGKICAGSIHLGWGWPEGWNAGSASWDCR